MIYDVMNEINNHFICGVDGGVYEITTDSIKGTFNDTYLAGMYIMINNSYLNDGVYKITEVASGKVTVDATLNAENTGKNMTVYALNPPSSFIDLVTDIEGYTEQGIGIASESIDDYSISYGNNGGGEWENTYRSKLNRYRNIYDDRKSILTGLEYNINNKSRW